MATRHVRWERTGADEHAAAYDEARASLMLGQMVHDRRVELGLTQTELADRAGMTQPQLFSLGVRRSYADCAAAGPPGCGAERRPRYRVPPAQPRRGLISVTLLAVLTGGLACATREPRRISPTAMFPHMRGDPSVRLATGGPINLAETRSGQSHARGRRHWISSPPPRDDSSSRRSTRTRPGGHGPCLQRRQRRARSPAWPAANSHSKSADRWPLDRLAPALTG
jgi:hypothetical protein